MTDVSFLANGPFSYALIFLWESVGKTGKFHLSSDKVRDCL